MKPLITCEHVDFGYENHDAVIDLNLEIYPGAVSYTHLAYQKTKSRSRAKYSPSRGDAGTSPRPHHTGL